MRKLFASVLVLMALLAVMPAALAAEDVQVEAVYEEIDLSELNAVSLFSDAVWEDDWTCYGDQLTGDALTIYEAFETAFANDDVPLVTVNYSDGTSAQTWSLENVITYNTTYTGDVSAVVDEWYYAVYDEAIRACYAFTYDHPEYFWIRRSCSVGRWYSYSSAASAVTAQLNVGFTAQPSCDTLAKRDALKAELTAVIDGILSAVEGKSSYEKLDYFDTWLAANNHYNYTAVGTANYSKTDDTPWSITGALLEDYSPVCEGYAKAFQLLCHKVGVPCLEISGDANGGGHMWTAAQLGGAWYFCDPTWDDPRYSGGSDRDYSTKEYFLVPQPSSHVVSMQLTVPVISAVDYANAPKSGVDETGILTIVNGEAAGNKAEGWLWKDGTLTLTAVEGMTIKAVRFLPAAGSATVKLNSDFTLDATDVKDPEDWWEAQSALELENEEKTLTVEAGEYTLTCTSEADGIRSAGSLVIDGGTIVAEGTDNCLYVDCGNLTIRNSTVTAACVTSGEGISVHGIRVGEERECEMGDLTIENSTVTAVGKSGNGLYADGDIMIVTSKVDASAGENDNGIGNDVGAIIIRDSTVSAVGEYLGICTYGTLAIENSFVTAKTITEGKRAIELTTWDTENDPPNVASFILRKCDIVTPEMHGIQLMKVKCGGGSMVWYDTVVTVADMSDPNSVTAAMEVVIEPAGLTLEDRLEMLIPEEGESITAEQVRDALGNAAERIATALTADLSDDNGVLQRLKELEQAVTNDVEVTSTHSALAGGEIIGAKLNAAQDAQTVQLKIARAEVERADDGYSAMTAFSMKLEGAVDADPDTTGQQLAVPVKITLPVPAYINPAFLMVLHYGADGGVEEIRPHIYQEGGKWYASFVVTSFSDFALASVTIEAETTETGVQVTANFAVDLPGQAICAVYDEYGKLLGVTELESMTAGEQTVDIVCDPGKAHTAKLFVLDGNGVPQYVESPRTIS